VVGVSFALSFSDPNTCETCGAHVSDRFVKVFGVGGTAHRCPECDTWVRIHEGSAAGRDVSTPDPRHAPGRHGGETA
jgi:hypothetical protein